MGALDQFRWISECQGIEVHILPDNSYSCRYCAVSIEKDSLTIGKKETEEGERSVLFKRAQAKLPLALSLTGKGVLIRKVARLEEVTNEQLNQLFPAIKADEFYVQNFISGAYSYIAIVRKELLKSILDVAQTKDVNILLVNLGPFPASHILKQLNNYGRTQIFDGHQIATGEELYWQDYQYKPGAKAEFPLKVGIEGIKDQFVLAYATAFQLALAPKLALVHLEEESLRKKFENFSSRLLFKFRLSLMLVVFFVLLLANFFVFNAYHNENQVLLAKVDQNAASSETLVQLNQAIRLKEKALSDLGWHKGKSYAWMCDELAQGIPAGISLSNLAINPLNAIESNRQRKEVFELGKIKIKGEAQEAGPVNEWIYLLKEKSWIKDLNLDNFSPAQDGDRQVFEITISY